MHGNFTWVDLSTFNVEEAKTFYLSVFEWNFTDGDSSYVNCSKNSAPCAGLYEMPEFFQKINMPSFWMTYISVSDIDSIVSKAKEFGGKVELEETNALGRIALIRDPAGAGFTCYEGASKAIDHQNSKDGQWCWSELFISDISRVNKFYTGLFGWIFELDSDSTDRYSILKEGGERIGSVQVASNEIRGDKEFWGVFFKVKKAKKALAEIHKLGGSKVYKYSNTEGAHYLVNDSQGAAFFLTEQDIEATTALEQSRSETGIKWRSLLGLILIYLAIAFEADWLWGMLFLFWVIPDLKSGVTNFIEPLNRSQNPVMYWAVVLTWIGLSVSYLFVNGI